MDLVLSNLLSSRDSKIYVHDRRMVEKDPTFDSGICVEKKGEEDRLEATLIPIVLQKHLDYIQSLE